MTARTERLVAELLEYALGLPEAWLDHPWGEDVAKVRTKVFVFFGSGSKPGSEPGFSVKLPESGEEARLLPFCAPTGYGLGKSGWVSVKPRASELGMRARFEAWILESYRAVAPKTLVKQLDGGAAPERAKSPARKKKVGRKGPARRGS
jgi:predicted DNA-binding protein (MmcQ/YjbR family)